MDQARVIFDLLNWIEEDAKFVYLTDKWPIEFPGPKGEMKNAVFDTAINEGRLEVTAEYSYRGKGEFDRSSLLDSIWLIIDKAKSEGFNRVLVGSDDSWVHDSEKSFDRHMVEAMQLTLPKLPPHVTVICQYDGRVFSREQLDRIGSVHQLSLVNGRIYRNYWVVSTKSWDFTAQTEGSRIAKPPAIQPEKQN